MLGAFCFKVFVSLGVTEYTWGTLRLCNLKESFVELIKKYFVHFDETVLS